jgi:hypothetical protein
MRKLFYIVILVVLTQDLIAQETIFEEKRTIYKREQVFGALIHTTGWGLTYKYGLYSSGFTRNTFEADLVGIKHPKEIQVYSSAFDNSNGYVYGKLNSIMVIRAGVGNHGTFISKQSVRGISISYVINGGLSLAYAKPVYLEVVDTSKSPIEYPIERYDPDKHPQGFIVGKASWFRGLFEGTFYPGLYLKGGLNFESSRQPDKINSIEVGAVLDFYFQKIPILAYDYNQNYFFNLYVSLTFGSKKTE